MKVLWISSFISILLGVLPTLTVAGQALELPSGDFYQGALRDGKFEGEGSYRFANGDLLEAEFSAGQPAHGHLSRRHEQYQGEFLDWRYHGQGTLKDQVTLTEYQGRFQHGDFVEGRVEGPDGSLLFGQFVGRKLHGPGQAVLSNGVRFSGEFEFGKPLAGERIHITAEGEEVRTEGVMHNGSFVPLGTVLDGRQRAQLNARMLAEDQLRLQQALARLTPQTSGRQDIYYLLVGGDGDDSVFVRDLAVVANWLQQHLPQAQGITLLNDRQYLEFPLATTSSVTTALAALRSKMDPEEDILFLHLASHGARHDGALTLAQPHVPLPSLTPEVVREALQDIPAVIVVSACFSGHWLDELKADNRLIMVSARRDRTSFGCGNESEMTWLTKALYVPKQDPTRRPAAFFRKLKRQIKQWEKAANIDEPSEPQLHQGRQAPRFTEFRK